MKLWDNHNKQWLVITAIYFDQEGNIERIIANVQGQCELGDPFYNIEGDDLKKIAINQNIVHNKNILPE